MNWISIRKWMNDRNMAKKLQKPKSCWGGGWEKTLWRWDWKNKQSLKLSVSNLCLFHRWKKTPYDQILNQIGAPWISFPANDQNQLLIYTSIIKLSYLGFILQPAVTVACILSLSYYCWIMRCTLCHFYSSDYWNKLEALLFSCPFLW